MEKFDVLSPVGDETITRKTVSPCIDTFEGKTIGEVWNGVYKGNATFPVLRELLKERYPGVKVIPYTEFPAGYGGETIREQRDSARKIAALAKEKGCDAVITGNGA
jgi:hypothetical protein